MTINECDKCWAKGGGAGAEGTKYLETYSSTVVNNAAGKQIARTKPNVLEKLCVKHLPRDVALMVLWNRCATLGGERCERIGATLNAPGELMEGIRRVLAEAPRERPLTIRSFIRSMWSWATRTRVSPHVVEMRVSSCFGGKDSPPCTAKVEKHGESYCSACGCGANRLSRLSGPKSKLSRFAYLECPRNKPGFNDPTTKKLIPLTVSGCVVE